MHKGTKKLIVKQGGITGVLYDGEIMSLTTNEVVDATCYKVIGSLHLTALHYQLYANRPNRFHKITGLVNSPRYEFYMLGEVSLMNQLNYVQLSDTVLMGYVSDTDVTSLPSVYYFYRCGEINEQPIFSYHSDMVIKEEDISWIGKDVDQTVSWKSED